MGETGKHTLRELLPHRIGMGNPGRKLDTIVMLNRCLHPDEIIRQGLCPRHPCVRRVGRCGAPGSSSCRVAHSGACVVVRQLWLMPIRKLPIEFCDSL